MREGGDEINLKAFAKRHADGDLPLTNDAPKVPVRLAEYGLEGCHTGCMNATSTLLEPSRARFDHRTSGTGSYVRDAVCRCGHGLSLHPAELLLDRRACRVCRLAGDQGGRTPSGGSCSEFFE